MISLFETEHVLRKIVCVFRPKLLNFLITSRQNYVLTTKVYPFQPLVAIIFNKKVNCETKRFFSENSAIQNLEFTSSTVNICDNLNNLLVPETDEDIEESKRIHSFLLSKGYYSNNKIREKCLQFIKSNICSYQKLKELESIGSDFILLLPLLALPLSILRLAAKQAQLDKNKLEFPDRIAYLSHNLELDANDLIPLLVKHSALLTMKFKRLDYKMKTLKNANISPKYLVKDLWIFNYNENLLVNRIQASLKAKFELKPWMLRCSKKFFESMLTRNSETQRILAGEDVVSYLAKKLNCSTEYIEHLMERNKLLKTVNIPKLDQILHFLFQKGYTPQEVRLFPRVFCSSVQTLSKRFEEYQQIKATLPTISQLCMSSQNFQRKLKKH